MLNQTNMPGAGSITDTLEFMRKMWGSMGAPAMGIPTLSVEEINKKIADLKTVASWLELNLNMLRATIQTMEVQSATLTTLQAMGAILTPRDAADSGAHSSAAAAAAGAFANWPQQTAKPGGEPAAQAKAQDEIEEEADDEPQKLDEQIEKATAAPASAHATDADTSPAGKAGALPDYQAAMSNPNAWWNLLQEQFQQAVGSVLAEQTMQPATAPKDKSLKRESAAVPPKPRKAAAPKKTTKPKAAVKPGTRAKSTVVQSRPSKSVSRKPQSP